MNLFHYLNKALVFIKPDKASYWHTITRCAIDHKPDSLGRYYLNFESKLAYPEKFDENDIPLWKTNDESYFYHPIVICQYAFGIFEHLYHKNFSDEELKLKFLKQADWLKNNFTEINCGKIWYIHYDIPLYGIKKPWYSALAQGEAVSVLTRAYLLTKDETYLNLAEDAIKPFFAEVKNGGLVNYFNSIPIYEEYPSQSRTVGVLNGFMFSLFGLYDLFITNKSENSKKLFLKGIDSLKELLPYYDTGYWARYFLYDYPKRYVASYTYISLMYEQLKVLYYLTGEKIFSEYSERWKFYTEKKWNKLRALLEKIIYANTVNK
ncbi:D-glucuronyl C5-epimerase domain protein [Ignavibacterium album JCM 16511]|uniref:D-glucuronyl C5-epimerase domain protein n=1 Tax=Ignavibacterium album (strain DSM 19864 / JCM 16511 / NBRC 101810 / Mat9-16) TaxID=945713 RepID=I0ALD0_IGNAJ|nr:D-glucuronyl C5-epimerase [Ignavibacterium album]AFH49787.1 D-glucuronyl C5-epimerase domain protein [Ignavibacterium album JCM 16511]